MAERAGHARQTLAGDQRSQHQLGHVLGERRDGRENQRRRPAEEHGGRQRLVRRFRQRVVEAAALADLPVHAGGGGIVHVQPVDRQVVAVAAGMFGVDERQRHERAAVLGPAGERRQPVEPRLARHHLCHRAHRLPFQPHLEQAAGDIARAPQLACIRRHDGLRQFDQPANESHRVLAEGQGGAFLGAEQVRHERIPAALHVREEQRRATGGDHAAMDLGGFEMRVDRRGDGDQVGIGTQPIHEGSKVWEHALPGKDA